MDTRGYPPGQGQTENSCHFSFKKLSSKSDVLDIFNEFIHVYNPGAGTDNPLWTKV